MTDTAIATLPDELNAERKRKVALLKAVGLDRVAPEQRELALAIAKRYDLDLLLKHLVLIDGRPYITRDALLWIAHRSGQFDGIEVTEPTIDGDFWKCEATVYRKDMSHPFRYGGRYPTKGGNQKFAPEMAVKVAESMALRRAFNVSAPTAEERWDAYVPESEPEQPKTLAEKAAEKAAEVAVGAWPQGGIDPETGELNTKPPRVVNVLPGEAATITHGDTVVERHQADEPAADAGNADQPIPESAPTRRELVQCESVSKLSTEQCRLAAGHGKLHRTDEDAAA